MKSGLSFLIAARQCEIAELERLHQSTEEAVASNDYAGVDAASWRFSKRINQLSGSSRLTWIMSSLGAAIPRSFVQTLPHCAPSMAEMQANLLDALRSGDAEKARVIAEEHTRNRGAEFIAYLRGEGILID